MPARILIVDDDPNMCQLIEDDLQPRGYEVSSCNAGATAIEQLRESEFDVILADMNMPGMGGIQLCERITAIRPNLPVIVITAFGSMESAIAAIRAGAFDFVTKPVELDMLHIVLERAIKHSALVEQVRLLNLEIARGEAFEEVIGESPVMQRLFDRLARVADSEASVMVVGESGTGKELVAKALHNQSRRKDQPFVAVNCAALPENLLESELFGHAKGAFTDAKQPHRGLVFEAHNGTLFFDEIGEFPLSLQPKLLRALEERSVRPVGGSQEMQFNVRVISATNRDLTTAVAEKRFREDLFYRLNVIQVEVPPLRSRGTDVLLLAQHFRERFAKRSGKDVTGITEPVAAKLLEYTWPGNVRELRNAMEHAVALTRFEKLSVEDLPERVRDYRSSQITLGNEDPESLLTMEEVERRYIEHVLKAVQGNKTMAARILSFDRKTLYRKMEKYRLEVD